MKSHEITRSEMHGAPLPISHQIPAVYSQKYPEMRFWWKRSGEKAAVYFNVKYAVQLGVAVRSAHGLVAAARGTGGVVPVHCKIHWFY